MGPNQLGHRAKCVNGARTNAGAAAGERMDQTLDTPGVPTPYLCSAADPDPPIPLLYAVRIKVPPLWRRSWGLLWWVRLWSGEPSLAGRWSAGRWWVARSSGERLSAGPSLGEPSSSEPWWSAARWWSEPWWSAARWWSEPWWSEPWWSEGLGPRRRWLGPRAGWCRRWRWG